MNVHKSIFKKQSSWILLFIFSICLTYAAFYLFDKTFPITNIKLEMSREDALRKSDSLSIKFNIGPQENFQVATFGVNQMEQNFIELDNGGATAFSDIIKSGHYKPYNWSIRHYMPGNVNEAWFKFTPSGEVYGFHEILSDTLYIDNLNSLEAKNFAVNHSEKFWNISFDDYEFLDEREETKVSGRIDRTFIYRMKNYKLGKEGEYRLEISISGNKLTKVNHFIKIPENFYNTYNEMRSFNNTIAAVASYAMVLLYILGGIVFGLFILNRQRWIVWKPAIYWALIVSVITTISGFNFLPLSWLSYNTAISSQSFMMQIILFSLINGIADFVLVLLSFVAAESLTRKAFPEHIQFWKLWTGNNAASTEVLGRTLGGYLLIALDLFFVVSFYYITSNYFGWWVPSGTLFEPNMIATPFPWLSSVGMSLHAGFWEECLFRAIPISGAILISKKYGHRTFWLVFAMIVQALIFAGAHANYPSYPSYSRLVELIIPSLFWGLIYIRFGLLPVIISHFGYDVVWFSLPLFVSNTPDLIFDKIMVITLTLIPIWVYIRSRISAGSNFIISSNFYNSSFIPPELEDIKDEVYLDEETPVIHKHYKKILLSLFIIGLLSLSANSYNEYINLKVSKSRTDVIALADDYLLSNNIKLSDEWTTLTQFSKGDLDASDRFIWQTQGPQVYKKLLGSYLDNSTWQVRYVLFTGNVDEKAEEYAVNINYDGTVIELMHKLPDNRVGEVLDEDSARILARIFINENYSLIDKDISEIKFEGINQVNRKDWNFEFSDNKTQNLKEGSLRIFIKISGNKVVQSKKYIYIPEQWENSDKQTATNINIINTLCSFILLSIFIYAAAVSIAKWSKNKFNVYLFRNTLMFLSVISILSVINSYPDMISYFDPSKPFINQLVTSFFGSILYTVLGCFIIAVVIGNVANNVTKSIKKFSFIEIGLISFSFIGLSILTSNPESSILPNWFGGTYPINTYVPLFDNVVSNITSYLNKSIFLIFIVLLINNLTDFGRKTWKMILIILLLTFLYSGSLLGQNSGIDTLLQLFKNTLWLCVVSASLYYYFIRFDLSIIPIFTVITSNFVLILNSSTGMYSGILAYNTMSVVVLVFVAYSLKKMFK